MNYPLYDYLQSLASNISDVKIDHSSEKIAEIFNFSLLNLIPQQGEEHRREILAIIYHHANRVGNNTLFNYQLLSGNVNSSEQNIRILLQELPIELRKILFAYIQHFS